MIKIIILQLIAVVVVYFFAYQHLANASTLDSPYKVYQKHYKPQSPYPYRYEPFKGRLKKI